MNRFKNACQLLFGITTLMMAGLSPHLHARGISSPVAEGALSVSPASGLDFGDVLVGASTVRRVTIINSGTVAMKITALRLHGAQFDFAGAPGLPMDLAPGGRANVDLRFTPATMERIDGSMEIETDASTTLGYAIRGRGIFPVLIVGRTSIDFGRVGVGESRIDSVMVRNGGSARLRNVEIEIPSEHTVRFEVVSPSSLFDLEPGERRQIAVRLRPQESPGVITATAMIRASDGLRGSVELSATIVGGPSRVAPDFITSGGISLSLSPVFPNPASEHAIVSIISASARDIPAVLLIVDLRGETIATAFDGTIHAGHTETISIDPRPFPADSYRVVLRAAGRIVSTELVVGR